MVPKSYKLVLVLKNSTTTVYFQAWLIDNTTHTHIFYKWLIYKYNECMKGAYSFQILTGRIMVAISEKYLLISNTFLSKLSSNFHNLLGIFIFIKSLGLQVAKSIKWSGELPSILLLVGIIENDKLMLILYQVRLIKGHLCSAELGKGLG